MSRVCVFIVFALLPLFFVFISIAFRFLSDRTSMPISVSLRPRFESHELRLEFVQSACFNSDKGAPCCFRLEHAHIQVPPFENPPHKQKQKTAAAKKAAAKKLAAAAAKKAAESQADLLAPSDGTIAYPTGLSPFADSTSSQPSSASIHPGNRFDIELVKPPTLHEPPAIAFGCSFI